MNLSGLNTLTGLTTRKGLIDRQARNTAEADFHRLTTVHQ